jgi:hypothetical protein
MPGSRFRLQTALHGLVQAAQSTGRWLDHDMARRLVRVYFGPHVIIGQLKAKEMAEVSAFLERLSDEFMLLEIEDSIRLSARPAGKASAVARIGPGKGAMADQAARDATN